MRIAYIAPYQGPTFFRTRPSLSNLGLAANVKIELISELLLQGGHSVEIISQGEVVGPRWRFYPSATEVNPFHADIPVYYASALPIRFVNGLWSGYRTLRLLRQRHHVSPFDLTIIYNLQHAQSMCGDHAVRRLRLPLVVEYEDDAFVNIKGNSDSGWRSRRNDQMARKTLDLASGGMAVSPHLLGQFPSSKPKLLLRGVVSDHILDASKQKARRNWVVYSGTHTRNKGLEQLVAAWRELKLSGWELHIAGKGETTAALEKMAKGDASIRFHGLLNRRENADFLSQAKIGINPHQVSQIPGNVFAFKIIEYLAAGVHCVTTPMGALEAEIEAGVTYMNDNSPAIVAATLKRVIEERRYERTAAQAAQAQYGPIAVSNSLDRLLGEVMAAKAAKNQNPSAIASRNCNSQ